MNDFDQRAILRSLLAKIDLEVYEELNLTFLSELIGEINLRLTTLAPVPARPEQIELIEKYLNKMGVSWEVFGLTPNRLTASRAEELIEEIYPDGA
jgi:hypothetical protein